MQFHIAVKCIQYNSQNISDIHVGHENKILIFKESNELNIRKYKLWK